MIDGITYKQIEQLAKRKGFPFFTAPFDLNVWGIRNPRAHTNLFDDTIIVAYKDSAYNNRVFACPATTDPGRFYLENPMDKSGCAYLRPGYYKGLWIYGKHKGKIALVQRAPISVDRLTFTAGTVINRVTSPSSIIGLDLHPASEIVDSSIVDKWSAGCQVVQIYDDHIYIMALVQKQIKFVKSGIVSYALVEEKDFA